MTISKIFFANDLALGIPTRWSKMFSHVDSNELSCLNDKITKEEIKCALFFIGGLKAPELDGILTMVF